MAAAMQVAPQMIVPVCVADSHPPYPRAQDCSLDSRRAYALGYHPTELEQALRQTVAAYRDMTHHQPLTDKGFTP
jgi:hypothetical protein